MRDHVKIATLNKLNIMSHFMDTGSFVVLVWKKKDPANSVLIHRMVVTDPRPNITITDST